MAIIGIVLGNIQYSALLNNYISDELFSNVVWKE